MRYDELALEIRGGGGDDSVVEVRSSGFGRGSAPFRLPFRVEALDRLLPALERRVRHLSPPGGEPLEDAGDSPRDPVPLDPAPLGENLFDALFHGDTAATFSRIEGRIEGRRDADGTPRGLRIRFVFDPEDPDLNPLSVVPWELLRRPATREFLAQGRHTPVVRCLDVPQPVRPLAVQPPLRVLLIESAPSNLARLDLPEERRRIREALQDARQTIELLTLPEARFGALREFLLSETVHAVHFMGHGDLTDEGEGVLYFEGPYGRAEAVPAETFTTHLRGFDTLKLVVLNACASGTLPRHRGRDPYSATAASLAMLGIPAVVAMQFPVSDRAAIAFSRTLYRRLAAFDPLEAAVAEARLAILADRPSSLEWITPVVYLRGDSGELFTAPSESEGEPTPAPPKPAPDPPTKPDETLRPLRLGIRSLEGLGEEMEEDVDEHLSLVRYFDGRPIRDERLWTDAVLPELRDFLRAARTTRRPVTLDLAAHQSIAYLCGALLEAKSGVNLSVVQRGRRGTEHWLTARPGEIVQEPLWTGAEEDLGRDQDHQGHQERGSLDVAVAVSVTHPVLDDVETYLETSGLRVHHILRASLPEPTDTAVRDGAHALRLAQTLARRIRRARMTLATRSPEARGGTVHLFTAAPNALLLFLGQLDPLLGPVQVYEYGLEEGKPGGYWPGVRWEARG